MTLKTTSKSTVALTKGNYKICLRGVWVQFSLCQHNFGHNALNYISSNFITKKFSGSSSASHSVIFSGSHFKEGLVTIPHAHVKKCRFKVQ